MCNVVSLILMILCVPGLRIKETKEVYEGEVIELTPAETENPMGGGIGCCPVHHPYNYLVHVVQLPNINSYFGVIASVFCIMQLPGLSFQSVQRLAYFIKSRFLIT